MRQVTKEAVEALENGHRYFRSNTFVNGDSLFLHGNEIVRKVEGGYEITLAGWNTTTTRERLNGLGLVRVSTKNGMPMLNGKAWNGGWTFIQ